MRITLWKSLSSEEKFWKTIGAKYVRIHVLKRDKEHIHYVLITLLLRQHSTGPKEKTLTSDFPPMRWGKQTVSEFASSLALRTLSKSPVLFSVHTEY
jgi:hypothetical protein